MRGGKGWEREEERGRGGRGGGEGAKCEGPSI